ncbi:hypothetical protein RRG08_042095 [Elysia crispata]|uniref:Uncharacterized protein n=1 Tax=Elysia crispata TaxID=231223 RepID=A0AAE1AGN7_9GAST|nr:hypothetical protein RRG08_042095 [Elysia crispata]
MYDYGIFRYPLYLVLCPQLSPLDEHVTKNRVGHGSNRLCSQIKKRKGTGISKGHCS